MPLTHPILRSGVVSLNPSYSSPSLRRLTVTERRMLLQAKSWSHDVFPSFLDVHRRIPPAKYEYSRHCFVALAAKRSPKRLKYSAPRFTREDELLYVKVDPSGADSWKLEPVVELLEKGAVGVIPTDTVYAIVCHLRSHSAIERLRRIKDIEASKPLSILVRSFQDIDTYTMGFPCGTGQGQANIFRAVKHCLPGPYTFILTASKELPKLCTRYGTTTAKYASRKNVGVRMPDDSICQAILGKMDAPLISTSVKSPKENEWMLDPVAIADVYGPKGLDFVVDGGVRVADPSTVVDMTRRAPTIIRQGKGPKLSWMVSEKDEDFAFQGDSVVIPNAA